jgi:1,2-diacylglycerol 3-alpha-glucosyltransferase
MRIGMMLDAYKPHVSGITNYVELNKRALEQLGHEVFVFTFGDVDYQDDESNVIRSPGLPLTDTGFFVSTRYNRGAQKILRTMDIVHVHHPFLSGRLAIRYCNSRGIPVVFTNHTRYDLYAKVYLPVLPEEISEALLKAYLPSFCRSVDMVIAPSAGLREVLVHLGVDAEITVVPNGVDLQRVRGAIEPIDRKVFGYDTDAVVFVYVGRLGGEKNLPFLLRAFGGIAESYDKARLLIVGDGPERENLTDRVQHMGLVKCVKFTGMVPYSDVPRYLKMADAFVTSSVTEVHPLSIIEAMGAGLPILGIASPGVSDTIEDGSTGFLAHSEDLASFTAKMARLVSEHEVRRKMGMNAQSTADQYDIARTVKVMEYHYQTLAQSTVTRKQNWRARLLRAMDRWAS